VIRLLILDVDGCLSDGKITYTADKTELKNFNVKDGFAIKAWSKLGYEVAIITGRNSTIVEHRANELGIKHLYQGVKDKLSVAEHLAHMVDLQSEEIAAIGDDLNDYRLLKWVGKAYTPRDGSEYLQAFANILSRDGGDACVREMIVKTIRENGDEDRFLKEWI